MRQHRLVLALAVVFSWTSAMTAQAQQPGAMGGRGRGMGMAHDSATMALAMGSHQLVMMHDRITRTVTNLANGVRTVTESNDPQVAALIREHVKTSVSRLATGDDPGLPMETPALHSLFRNSAKIRTTSEPTPNGVVVTQTSDDATVVAELQTHAAEVSRLVEGGMAALHESMMKNGGMRMGGMGGMGGRMGDHMGGQMGGRMGGTRGADSAFRALQDRGKRAMGVDQYTSTHRFEALPDGGRIELQRDVDDSAGAATIRSHLREIARAFASGDFSTPAVVHMQEVPGVKVMTARRGEISYTYHDLPRGGEVRIQTKNPEALTAIREFLAFQRADHRAP